MAKKKLYLSNTDKKIAGVCGGIAEYFGIDATIVRIALVVFIALGGSGLLLYLIGWAVMPKRPEVNDGEYADYTNDGDNG
ncbi:MAG: PspC domain-containing protein [Clostridia bacterium]|nr:PspC domain-containing protein [Clostridia bacterium]